MAEAPWQGSAAVQLCSQAPREGQELWMLVSGIIQSSCEELCGVEDTLSSQTEEGPPRPCLLSSPCWPALWAASAEGLAGVRSQKNGGVLGFHRR